MIRTAAAFIATVFTVCYLASFAVPATIVNADVGQPDIPVPALSDVHCASYCVYDKTTGYIVISMNPDDRIYPASMTKIMTCMLSLEYLNTSSKLEVSKSALEGLDADSSLMGILEGEKVKVSELLYGLMLPSGNDAANVLGEGCVDAFFEKYPAGGTTLNSDGVNAQYILDTLHDNKDHNLNVRHLENYRYSNLFVFMHTEFPNGNVTHDTIECMLAMPDGRWMGKGSGTFRSAKVLLNPALRFPLKGDYHFEIEQAMREKELKGITDIGICFEKQ